MAAPTASLAQDAREIMIKVDDATNHSYSSSVRLVKFSTCRYSISGGKLSCAEKPRVVIFESFSKSHRPPGRRDNDNKGLDVIIQPISDKNTAMLSWGYAEDDKATDFWVYLPVLSKVRRIVSVADSGESGAVFGSEVSAEDADVKKVRDYTYEMLGEDTHRGRPVWKIELTPTASRSKRSYYGRIVSYVDKERFIVLKEDLYDRTGRHYKQYSVLEVEQFGEVWMATKAVMNNLTKRRITHWEHSDVVLNVDIDDEFLSQRSLTDFAYRERHMQLYRKYLTQEKVGTQQAAAKP
ncbi:outer membrane lipoprotein-sorting protein [Steroidobacter sp. S1-65]|uniref:Outer membrane lipoprotein-sorting protein n=1 Tax=Steroidobacter gossypii TaxID=2805490 RepID=A0ABS1X5T1_9GAMM|nr:outer membrane lipoprotein-sorting protein [Steroidobacter gossypii]MBM0108582.1 outer membrane lipoprotein-sorting protein [Steroidobacter gossypii]